MLLFSWHQTLKGEGKANTCSNSIASGHFGSFGLVGRLDPMNIKNVGYGVVFVTQQQNGAIPLKTVAVIFKELLLHLLLRLEVWNVNHGQSLK